MPIESRHEHHCTLERFSPRRAYEKILFHFKTTLFFCIGSNPRSQPLTKHEPANAARPSVFQCGLELHAAVRPPIVPAENDYGPCRLIAVVF